MFYGEYVHGIDPKGRIILPSRFRDAAKENNIEKFFVTRGLDKCIFMFSEYEWRIQEQKFKNLSFTKQEARTFNRMFFSGACDVVPDAQGRFIIPQYLKDYAEISKETIVLGVSNRIEIWDNATWKDFFKKSNSIFEQTAEKMMDL
jgi:MraZ protein